MTDAESHKEYGSRVEVRVAKLKEKDKKKQREKIQFRQKYLGKGPVCTATRRRAEH